MFEDTFLRLGNEVRQTQLYIPEAGSNLLGRYSIVQLWLELGTECNQIVVKIGMLTEENEGKIDTIMWAREGNRGRLEIPPLKIKLKKEGEVVCQEQYPISLEGQKRLQPVIEGLLKDGLLEPCMSPFNSPILAV